MQNFIKLLFFKTRQNFTIEIKNVAKIVYSYKKKDTLKKQEKFREKNSWKYVTSKLYVVYFFLNPFVPDPEHINGIDSYLLMIQAKMKDTYQTFTNYKKDWAMK